MHIFHFLEKEAKAEIKILNPNFGKVCLAMGGVMRDHSIHMIVREAQPTLLLLFWKRRTPFNWCNAFLLPRGIPAKLNSN
jgi:hypothetical protein